MPVYEVGFASVAGVASGWYFDLLAGADDFSLKEMHLTTQAATTSPVALFRTTATGTRTTPTTPTAAQCALYGTGNNPTLSFATAWSVNPTNAANAMRRFQVSASIGAGVIWTWYGPEGGLRVPSGSSIAVFNSGAATGSVLNVVVIWEE